MSLLKQLNSAARTSWCPSARYSTLIASGTIAGTLDEASFVTKSSLEIYDINLAQGSDKMQLIGSIESKDCFSSVAWGQKGIDDGSMSHGIVAGGMSDGSINMWNVDAILQHHTQEALISRSEVHKGQVTGLQFHPSQPNLLASGGVDGDVLVWDLANMKAPAPSRPNAATKPLGGPGVTSLAWNKNAPQILASANEIGETTVWDLRQKRSIITIRNAARMNVRTSGLSWNPAAGVQLAVCYNHYPVAEIWDLRQSMTPKVKLEGFHSGTILSLDWCPNDPSILLTAGEDGRMASWNPLTGNFLSEYFVTPTAAFDIQWSPKQPNLISTSTYDGKVNIVSINTTGPNHVPSWMTRPIGANFGFGGKLVTFGLDAPPPIAAAAPTGGPPSPHKPHHPKIQLQQLVTDPEVLDKAQGLQQILKEGDYPNFCAYKITHSEGDEDEKTIWTFMKILFEEGSSQRYLLLKELGFEPPPQSDIVIPQPSVPVVPNISEDDFFNQDFPTPKVDEDALAAQASSSAVKENGHSEQGAAQAKDDGPFVENNDDAAIRQALVFGDFKAAVAKCLAVGRMADAIIFASFGAPPLWEETRAKYFESHKSPFIRNIMKNVSNQSLDEMVQESQLENWKETLSICITYTTTTKFRTLVNALAERLEQAGWNIPAVICYICSSNVDKAIEMWTSKIPMHHQQGASGNDSALLSLHAAIEKIAVFAHATNALQSSAPSKILSLKYAEYANMLASQGELRGAFNYLHRVAVPNDPNSAVLLDRIFHAESEQFVREQYPMPAFPFQVERVELDPTLSATLNQQAQQKAHRAQMMAQQRQGQQQQQQQTQAGQYGAQSHHNPHNQPPRQPNPTPHNNPGPYGAHNGAPNNYGGAGGHQAHPSHGGPPPNNAYGNHAPAPYGNNPAGPGPAHGGYNPNVNPNAGPYGVSGPHNAGTSGPQGRSQFPSHQPPPQNNNYQPPNNAAYPPHGGNAPPPHNSYGGPPPPSDPYNPSNPANRAPFNPAPTGNYGAPMNTAPTPAYHQPPPVAAAPVPYHPAPAGPTAAAPYTVPTPAANTYGAPSNAYAPPPVTAAPRPFVPSPATAAPAPATAPVAAAASVAASSEAPVSLSPPDQALIAALEGCLGALTNVGLKTPEQKKVVEIRTKLNDLARKLAGHELTPGGQTELQQLCQAVQASDFTAAQRHHTNIVRTDWSNNSEWLLAVKTMLLMAKKYLEKTG